MIDKINTRNIRENYCDLMLEDKIPQSSANRPKEDNLAANLPCRRNHLQRTGYVQMAIWRGLTQDLGERSARPAERVIQCRTSHMCGASDRVHWRGGLEFNGRWSLPGSKCGVLSGME